MGKNNNRRKAQAEGKKMDITPKDKYTTETSRYDKKLAAWRKTWEECHGSYITAKYKGLSLPCPLYDIDLEQWTDRVNQSCEIDFSKIDKQRLLKFYNAAHLVENIELNEAAHKRYEELFQSPEYKKMMEDLDNY